jgi:hypothetical protein
MSDLTQLDGNYRNVAMNGDEKDWTVGASRWTKGDHDRLYFNDTKFVDYVDLDSLRVSTDAANTSGTAEIDGDTLTVEVVLKDDIVNKEKRMSATFALPDDLAEAPAPCDLDADATSVMTKRESGLVTDGGEDTVDVSDDDIEQAIAAADDPEHPDAHTVDGVRGALNAINRDILGHWGLHEEAIDEGVHEIVHEDRDVIVLADHSGQFWSEQLDATDDVDADEHGILQSIIIQLHHKLARRHSDRSWSVATPVVVQKSEVFQAGEDHVLREIARRTAERGRVAGAVDQLATEVHGWSKSGWAGQTGRNASTLTRTTRPTDDQ